MLRRKKKSLEKLITGCTHLPPIICSMSYWCTTVRSKNFFGHAMGHWIPNKSLNQCSCSLAGFDARWLFAFRGKCANPFQVIDNSSDCIGEFGTHLWQVKWSLHYTSRVQNVTGITLSEKTGLFPNISLKKCLQIENGASVIVSTRIFSLVNIS